MQNTVLLKNDKSDSVANSPEVMIPTGRSYHEIAGLKHETRDVLKQLNLNIRTLEDLSGRLGFVLSEVRSLIRK
jgi:hypothetical protein